MDKSALSLETVQFRGEGAAAAFVLLRDALEDRLWYLRQQCNRAVPGSDEGVELQCYMEEVLRWLNWAYDREMESANG